MQTWGPVLQERHKVPSNHSSHLVAQGSVCMHYLENWLPSNQPQFYEYNYCMATTQNMIRIFHKASLMPIFHYGMALLEAVIGEASPELGHWPTYSPNIQDSVVCTTMARLLQGVFSMLLNKSQTKYQKGTH